MKEPDYWTVLIILVVVWAGAVGLMRRVVSYPTTDQIYAKYGCIPASPFERAKGITRGNVFLDMQPCR